MVERYVKQSDRLIINDQQVVIALLISTIFINKICDLPAQQQHTTDKHNQMTMTVGDFERQSNVVR